MSENPFNPKTKIEESNPRANKKLVAKILSEEDAAAYVTLNRETTDLHTLDETLTKAEVQDILKAKPATPESIIKLLRESESPAELDTSFKGGVVSIENPPSIMDWKTAKAFFRAIDKGSEFHITEEWTDRVWNQPQMEHFNIIVLSYNNAPTIRQSYFAIIDDMERVGLRPLTVEEMAIAGALEPKFTRKEHTYFVGLTSYTLNAPCVPVLFQSSFERRLSYCNRDTPWNDDDRFLCVLKESQN